MLAKHVGRSHDHLQCVLSASFVVAPMDIVRTKKLGSMKVDETDLDPSYFGFF
jgi:hypothetical protein